MSDMLAVHAMAHGTAAFVLFVALVAFIVGLVVSLLPKPRPLVAWAPALLFLGLALIDFRWLWDELARA